MEWRLSLHKNFWSSVLNFTTSRYAFLFSNSETYIVHVINCEWSRSVNFSFHNMYFPSPSWPSINFDGIRDRVHTLHQNINQFDMKTHLELNLLQTNPFHPIIGLTHIKFDSHLTHLPRLLLINMMHCLKSNQHIISNKALRHECTLSFDYKYIY